MGCHCAHTDEGLRAGLLQQVNFTGVGGVGGRNHSPTQQQRVESFDGKLAEIHVHSRGVPEGVNFHPARPFKQEKAPPLPVGLCTLVCGGSA
jgi:hypothetical protein